MAAVKIITGPRIENRSWDGRVMDVWPAAEGAVRFFPIQENPQIWFEVKLEDGVLVVRCDGGFLLTQVESFNALRLHMKRWNS